MNIKIWDLITYYEIKSIFAHYSHVTSVVLSTDSTYIVSGGVDKAVNIFDFKSGDKFKTYSH